MFVQQVVHGNLGARAFPGQAADDDHFQAGLKQGYISELESGRKTGSLDALKALAKTLRCRLDDLAPLD